MSKEVTNFVIYDLTENEVSLKVEVDGVADTKTQLIQQGTERLLQSMVETDPSMESLSETLLFIGSLLAGKDREESDYTTTTENKKAAIIRILNTL